MDSKESKPKAKQNKDDGSKASDTKAESTADESFELPKKKQKKKKAASTKHGAGSKKYPKVIRDANAPKYPFTGYVRFSNERREEMKRLCPEMTVLEVTKKMAEEWNNMVLEKKKPFLDAAEIDKQRYHREMKEYLAKKKKEGGTITTTKSVKRKHSSAFNGSASTTTDGSEAMDVSFSSVNASEASNKMKPRNGPASQTVNQKSSVLTPPSTSPPLSSVQFGDIPIFTDQFLEHNRRVESELRQLRKSNTDYELQNSVLEKHIESMTNGVTKIAKECDEMKKHNEIVDQYLQQLRLKLANALSSLSIANKPGGATINNIDAFMEDLVQMATSNSHGPASLNKAKDILRKLDLNIQL